MKLALVLALTALVSLPAAAQGPAQVSPGLLAQQPGFRAQSLRDQREDDATERRLASEAAYTSSICGVSVASSVDWRSVAQWPAFADLVAACDGALGAVEASCRAGRTGLVRRFVCAGDGSGPSLSRGVLRYGAAPVADGFAQTKALLDSQP